MTASDLASGYRYRRYKKPSAARAKKYILLAAVLAAVVGLFVWFQRNVNGLLVSLSEATVRSLALSALNDAAAEALQWNGIDYDSLVTIARDAEGEIHSVKTDARQLNLLARQTVALAATKLNAACAQGVQGPAGALLTFESDSPAYSYLQYGADGNVCHTVEKQVVSHDAICGAYYFKDKATYLSACAEYLHTCQYQEFFVSGVYNVMAGRGQAVRGFATDLHLPFGTPAEYALAERPENAAGFEALKA